MDFLKTIFEYDLFLYDLLFFESNLSFQRKYLYSIINILIMLRVKTIEKYKKRETNERTKRIMK